MMRIAGLVGLSPLINKHVGLGNFQSFGEGKPKIIIILQLGV